MIHQGQRLPLGIEPGQDLSGIHAQFDEFQRGQALDRRCLLRHEHGAHAALAESFQQLVPAGDDRSDTLVGTMVGRGLAQAGAGWAFLTRRKAGNLGRAYRLLGRLLQKAAYLRMGGEEAFDSLP